MYKLLSILLFAFGISSSSEYDKAIQSRIDFRVDNLSKDINSILDPNKYFIEVSYNVIDTIHVSQIITKNNDDYLTDSIRNNMDIDNRLSLLDVEDTNIILVVDFICNPFISKLLEQDKELRNYKRTLAQLIENNHWCEDDIDNISFKFIEVKAHFV